MESTSPSNAPNRLRRGTMISTTQANAAPDPANHPVLPEGVGGIAVADPTGFSRKS
jgi:hypothetical protein